MMYDTILGLLHIDTNHKQDIYDLSSPAYHYTRSDIRTLYGNVSVMDDPYDR